MSNLRDEVTKRLPLNQVVFKGECIDNNDPKRLGRVRAILKSEKSSDRERANNIKESEKWTSKDPFVYKPLLPWFMGVIPNKTEYLHLFFSNIDRKGSKDKYFVSGIFSHPTLSNIEPYDSANLETEEGSNNKDTLRLLDDEGNYKNGVEGVYGEPSDISIYGRGSADIIIRDNTVLLRAGKKINTQPNTLPRINEKRSFLQLSNFESKTEFGNPQKKYKLSFEHKPIKKLIEYTLLNAENTEDNFSGYIYIFHMDSDTITTENMKVYTKIPSSIKQKQTTINFINLSMKKVIELTNKVINGVIEGNLLNIQNFEGVIVGEDNQFIRDTFDTGQVFPLFFRPNEILYKKYSDIGLSTDLNSTFNASQYINGVKIRPDLTAGHSLVYDNTKKDSVPFKKKYETTIDKKITPFNKSVSIMGGDEIYLLSHNSQKPSQGFIDISNSMLGINENQTADELEPKTSSLVRGEELKEFLQLVINFLSSHVHPWHGTPPSTVSLDGTSMDEILNELQLSSEKILNKYIRIN